MQFHDPSSWVADWLPVAIAGKEEGCSITLYPSKLIIWTHCGVRRSTDGKKLFGVGQRCLDVLLFVVIKRDCNPAILVGKKPGRLA